MKTLESSKSDQEQNDQQKGESSGAEMGLMDHLGELRRRLILSAIAITITSVLAYNFSKPLFELLTAPYSGAFPSGLLIGTGPAEAFILRIKVAIFAGILLASPFLFLQVWLFVAPGLYPSERKLVLPFVFSSSFLFMLGVWLCYKFMLPVAFDFFAQQYAAIAVTPTIRISEHLSTTMTSLFGFGVVFEMPILAFFLGRVGVVTDKTLISGARYAIVIIFIISAVLTPPDVLSQMLMAGPLLFLYGLSIFVVRWAARGRKLEEASE